MDDKKFEFVKIDEQASEHITAPVYSYWKSVATTFCKNKLAVIMFFVAVFVVIFSFVQPMFSNYDPLVAPNITDFSMRFLSPSLEFPFGTDHIGNSLFDAVWAACGSSLEIAFTVTTINMVVGILVGALWGFSKKVDAVMMEVYNIFANIPYTLYLMVAMYVLGIGKTQLIIALISTGWLSIAYFIRVQVMIIRDREYNLASKCLGTSTTKMVSKNILPYMISVIMTLISREIPAVISNEVFLSFIGIGLTLETPSIGKLISEYTSYMNGYPYLFWIPVGVLALVSISLYIVGQSLADASDPRTHR